MDYLALAIFLSVGAASMFSMISIVAWSDARRMERETYYRSELLKKAAESDASGAAATIEYLRTQEATASRRRNEAFKLGGLITAAAGIGLMIFLRLIVSETAPPIYTLGLIPTLIGAVLLVYTYTSPRA
jgi:ferric-dicitrate binding protein FerR (iron transport regulator)